MGLTTAGRNLIAKMLFGTGASGDWFNSGNARIGVGNSATAFNASNTDLIGGSKLRKGMVTSYPTLSTNALTFRSSFGTSEANFIWAEWGVFNSASGATMLNRKVEALGTKTGGTWVLTVTLTVNAS